MNVVSYAFKWEDAAIKMEVIGQDTNLVLKLIQSIECYVVDQG